MHAQRLAHLVDVARLPDDADQAGVQAAWGAIAALVAWCESQRLRCVTRLRELGDEPAEFLSGSGAVTPREAGTAIRRAETSTLVPAFADALGRGEVGAGHLDELSRSMRRLSADQQQRLLERSDELIAIAAACHADDFGRELRRHERSITKDDGVGVFRRLQASVRVRDWVDCEDGMHVWMLRVDPFAHLKLHSRVHAATEALFHDRQPDNCPADPVERQSFLRAHALLQLVLHPDNTAAAVVPPDAAGFGGKGLTHASKRGGRVGRTGRPEVIVVVDARAPTAVESPTTAGAKASRSPDVGTTAVGGTGIAGSAIAEPIVDWGIPVELPPRVLHDLWGVAEFHTVVVQNGVVIHAPGTLDLGRSTRLANLPQRRALRALYPSCAIPGCHARYDVCDLHHVTWWRHGGRTDLGNLLPLCSRHHHSVHDAGWKLHLADNRTLSITKPDGTTRITGPPTRRAA
jgi:hypothetical protein